MKVFRAISITVLTFLVLMSSTSFMVGMHICGGEIQNIALFDKAEGCEKEKKLPPCHTHETPACCQDQTVVHKGDDVQSSVAKIQVPAPSVTDIEVPRVLLAITIPSTDSKQADYFNYDPPLRSCDLTVDFQVFII